MALEVELGRKPVASGQNPLRRFEKGAEFLQGRLPVKPTPPKVLERVIETAWSRKKKNSKAYAGTWIV